MPQISGRLRPPRLASAPASPALGEEYYDTGLNELLFWDGTGWVYGGVEVYEQAAQPASTNLGAIWIDTDETAPAWEARIPVVSALPGSPFDGQEVYFWVNPMPGVWHLRYSVGSGKWDFLGGPPLYSERVGTESLTETTFTYNHAPPGITVPLTGLYDLEHGFHAHFYGQGGANGICNQDLFRPGVEQITGYDTGGCQVVSAGVTGTGSGSATWNCRRATRTAGTEVRPAQMTANQVATLLGSRLIVRPVGSFG